jgi:Leucine-rich repeat (LRR) protein
MAESAAEQAYRQAVIEIGRVSKAGDNRLDLNKAQFHALDRIPAEISQLSDLVDLNLAQTSVDDLAPLTGLTALQSLGLTGTAVADLSPLARLTALQHVALSQTSVADLGPLANLTALNSLSIDETGVTDLSPLAELTSLQGLILDKTAVANLAPLSGLTGLHSLYLSRTAVADLSPLAGLSALRRLFLTGTAVADLAPLAGLENLVHLYIGHTEVMDLSPLSKLNSLQWLFLDHTPVADLAPLAGHNDLQNLSLNGTAARDLRPLLRLTRLGTLHNFGLSFQDSEATRLDADLSRLSGIKNLQDCARQTLAYLHALPPWPEPYTPRAKPDGLIPQPIGQREPEVPPSVPAPLQVVELDGVLRPAMPDDALNGRGRLLASQGWQALRDYLTDLAPLRPKIHNQMPNMSRALDRFDAALGPEYFALNAIALGIHGSRIARLAAAADDSLALADAAELAEFAAAVALFLERFPAWRDYQDAEASAPTDPASVVEALPRIDVIVADLFDRPSVAPEIPEILREQAQSVYEDPEDALAVRGMLDSVGNLLKAFGRKALLGIKTSGLAARDFVRETLVESRKLAAKGLGGTLLGAAIDILANKAQLLYALAEALPKWFGWLTPLLRWIGV